MHSLFFLVSMATSWVSSPLFIHPFLSERDNKKQKKEETHVFFFPLVQPTLTIIN